MCAVFSVCVRYLGGVLAVFHSLCLLNFHCPHILCHHFKYQGHWAVGGSGLWVGLWVKTNANEE
jgi:hypothetical protein